mmetsp:Transcript_46434/g.140616  ORF Transcript_46434/g.140616 Transcript_46434/m.140616 type:complete len:249 (+) Transcript_46434:4630-5376(+)
MSPQFRLTLNAQSEMTGECQLSKSRHGGTNSMIDGRTAKKNTSPRVAPPQGAWSMPPEEEKITLPLATPRGCPRKEVNRKDPELRQAQEACRRRSNQKRAGMSPPAGPTRDVPSRHKMTGEARHNKSTRDGPSRRADREIVTENPSPPRAPPLRGIAKAATGKTRDSLGRRANKKTATKNPLSPRANTPHGIAEAATVKMSVATVPKGGKCSTPTSATKARSPGHLDLFPLRRPPRSAGDGRPPRRSR